MSLIRDEDHCCYISGVFTLVSLSLICYHRSVASAVRLQHCVVCISVSIVLPSPLRGRWACVPYVSECAYYFVHVYFCRTSHFEQSCQLTDFRKAKTIGSQQTTEPIRRRQKTESGGFNKYSAHRDGATCMVHFLFGTPPLLTH